MSITSGHRVFAPSWIFTLVTAVLMVVFIGLGRWQWHKGMHSQEEWDRFARGTEQAVALGERPLGDVSRFQRVSLSGRYDGEHQFLLDNRSHNGIAGYEVLTPLRRPNGGVLLIDRGWVPFTGSRARLPVVAIQDNGSDSTVTGRSDELPTGGLASGRAPPPAAGPWPRVTTYPTISELSSSLGAPLETRIVLLDPQEQGGYVRDWQPPGLGPLRYWAYAIQWWAFAALAVGAWLARSLHRRQEITSATL